MTAILKVAAATGVFAKFLADLPTASAILIEGIPGGKGGKDK